MKKYVRISRFAHFKRLRDRPTDRPTDRSTDMTSYRSARTHLKRKLETVKYLNLVFVVIADENVELMVHENSIRTTEQTGSLT